MTFLNNKKTMFGSSYKYQSVHFIDFLFHWDSSVISYSIFSFEIFIEIVVPISKSD